MKTVLLTALASLLSAASVTAQVATINTRGQEPSQPPMAVTGGTGTSNPSEAATKSLQMKVSLPAFANLVVGEPFDYELTITNRSNKPIAFPRALTWSAVEDQSQHEQRYQELETSFSVMAEDGDRATIDGHLAVYGTETNPATMITVPPGGSIQILGSAPFAPVWERPPAPGTGMHLVAYLAINSARLRPRDAQGERYRDDERQIFRAVSSNELEISFREPQ